MPDELNSGTPILVTPPPEAFRRSEGHCWTIDLDKYAPGDSLDDPRASALVLLEDGRPLGPAHASHNQIRAHGRGLYSHWNSLLYMSTSDNTDPSCNGRTYSIQLPSGAAAVEINQAKNETPPASLSAESPLFARLAAVLPHLQSLPSAAPCYEPAGRDDRQRMRLLEAKVEYLLDELYVAKSQLRLLAPQNALMAQMRRHQIGTFDFQWKNLPYHDAFLTNEAWRSQAADDVCRRVDKPRDWFRGKRILDCGCGPGRHAWTFASLGASVTAFDTSDNGLADARKACADFSNVTFEKRNILEPLPYPRDYDLVWSYGVVHCTGDTYGALKNIAEHVAPGGLIYFMVYPEPERPNIDDYVYYHEVAAIRRSLSALSFEERAEILKKIQGERWALSWFDAISSEINDLYTVQELTRILMSLGFEQVRRTMPDENSHNILATKGSQRPGA